MFDGQIQCWLSYFSLHGSWYELSSHGWDDVQSAGNAFSDRCESWWLYFRLHWQRWLYVSSASSWWFDQLLSAQFGYCNGRHYEHVYCLLTRKCRYGARLYDASALYRHGVFYFQYLLGSRLRMYLRFLYMYTRVQLWLWKAAMFTRWD